MTRKPAGDSESFQIFTGMGLSGRKTKQRIPDDPRNLCWADGNGVLMVLIFLLNRLFLSLLDAARFGSNYLAKFGWDGSTGLGAAGDGRRSHIKVSHKLDLLGIGAAQQKDPDGIAWKQNNDFERLLQRLNDEAPALENNQTLESGKKEEEEVYEKDGVSKKKRKHREGGEFKTEGKKKRKADNEGKLSSSNTVSATIQHEKIETAAVKKAVIVPRHRAQVKSLSFVTLYMLIYQNKKIFSHRARAINAKNMSSKSAAHISEILGIASTPSSSHLSEGPLVKLTSLTNELEIEKITTSTKSVADYFKEKLDARSFSSTIVSASTQSRDSDTSYDTPRMGLGSRARLETLTAIGEVDRESPRMGLSPTFPATLIFKKTLEDEGSATAQMNANFNPQTKDLKKQKEKKSKDEEMENGDGASEDNDGTKEREERKRKRKLDKAKEDRQDDLEKQKKRIRKAEKLQVSVTSSHIDMPVDEEKPQKERKERKKGSKPR